MRRPLPWIALAAALLAAGCASGPGCLTQREPVCFDDETCIRGSSCDAAFGGIFGFATFTGPFDVDRALEALRFGGHPEARVGDDGRFVVATNLTIGPTGSQVWRLERPFPADNVTGVSGVEVERLGEDLWLLVQGAFRNELLRFEGGYDAMNERVGWGPLVRDAS